MEYQDFVLQLDLAAGDQGFTARVIRSPAGEAEAPFVNPITSEELDGLWKVALAARQASRYHNDRDLAVGGSSPSKLAAELSLEDLGDRLFRALFQGPVRSCWVRSLADSAQSSDAGLRLKLQLSLADPRLAPLAELPWEYLYSLENGGFLGLQRRTPILRHMRLPLPPGKAPVASPLRLLIVSAQPSSLPPLALETEAGRIAETLGSLPGVETLALHNPSLETLRDTLLQRDFHVLHFMGHGGFDAESGQGVLFLTDSNGSPLRVSGSLLASHLAGVPSLRLVFVNACETARANSRAPFAGVATALLRAGLPAVVAMQRPIQDGSALEFSRTVYRRLAAGDPIDAAVTEGRLAIARGRGAALEWGTPVVFLRAEDGQLFHAGPTAAASELQVPFPAPSQSAPAPATVGFRKRSYLFVLLLLAALGSSLGTLGMRWLSGPEDYTEPIKPAHADNAPVDSRNTVIVPAPPPEAEDKKIETKPVTEVQDEPIKKVAKPPVPSPSSFEVTDEGPTFIPGLEVEVAARFFERAGYKFARFSLTPKDAGMLEQQPVMGAGSIEFPAPTGTYHLDVLSLDREEKRARVRVRFTPAALS